MKKRIKDELKQKKFRVTIFGSARAKRGDKEYKDIYNLAKKLGNNGMEIVTGGGPGIMEAASRGHKKGRKNINIHSIGLNIKLPLKQKINKSTDFIVEFSNFTKRLDNFMLLSNVIIVGPGGVGTLLELFYSWQLMQVNQICHLPIILFGDEWKGLLKWLKETPLKDKYFSKDDFELLFHAKNLNEIMEIVEKAHIAFKEGDKNFCLNVNKYKI